MVAGKSVCDRVHVVSDVHCEHAVFVLATPHANGAVFACRVWSCVCEWTWLNRVNRDHRRSHSRACMNSHSSEIQRPWLSARASQYAAGQIKVCYSMRPAPRNVCTLADGYC